MPPKGPPKKRKAPAAAGALSDSVALESGEASPAPTGGPGGAFVAGGQVYAPLKPPDGAPLLRRVLQWDALETIFTSYEPRFTPPSYPDETTPLFPPERDWSFAELYLDCIANSSKANRNLKDKMGESTAFAVNFAKLCLLINVGRINTTLAFYPEMKTALRTYHPIPSMQLEEFSKKNLQDAPRMKAQLKGCHLPSDKDNPPDSLAEVIRRATVLSWKPPACVATLIFLLYTEWARISQKYFPDGFILPDLFFPGDPKNTIPSKQRAQAFLWLVHRFLETPEQVAADFANGEERLPAEQLLHLTREDCTNENVDTQEELEYGVEMQKAREAFVENWMKIEENANGASALSGADDSTPVPDEKKGKSHLLEKTSSQPGRKGRAASTTPAKKARIAAGHHDSIGTPTLTSPLKPTVEAALNTTPVPTIKLEQSLTVHVPPPGPISSGVMTPTAVAPQLLASMNNTTLYSRADLWRHALRKKRGDIAAVAKLVPVSEGVADPEVVHQWNQFYQIVPKKERSLLQLAWQKTKRDIEMNRDPVYESEDEPEEWALEELKPRLSGFLFRNHQTHSKDVVRYQGHGPAFDTDQLLHYIESIDQNDEIPRSSMSPEPRYQGSGEVPSSPPPSGISPTLTHSTIMPAHDAQSNETVPETDAMALDNDATIPAIGAET